MDDAFLNLLWKYKGKMDSFTLSSLEFIRDLIEADPGILGFFLRVNYLGWVLPYLTTQKEQTLKYRGTGSDEKLKKIEKLMEAFANVKTEEIKPKPAIKAETLDSTYEVGPL